MAERAGSRWTRAAVVAAPLMALATVVPPARGADVVPVVEAARQVTTHPSGARAHSVPVVAVNPADPNIVAVGEAEAYTASCAAHISINGGRTWATSPIPQDRAYPKCVYSNFGPIVDVAFGSDGTLFYTYSGFNPVSYHSRMYLARSSDLGATWETTALPWVEPDLARNEFGSDALPTLAVDPRDPNRVYVAWSTNNGTFNLEGLELLGGKTYFNDFKTRPYLAASSDGGKTFGPAIDLAPDIAGTMASPHVVVGTGGQVYVFFGENTRPPAGSAKGTLSPPAHLFVAISTDRGKTFAAKAAYTQPAIEDGWLGETEAAVDPRNGTVYVVWDDLVNDKPYVAIIRSSDGGETWSAPRKVNDAEPLRSWSFCQFCPGVSVAPDGRVDVAFYDWRNDSSGTKDGNVMQDVYFSYSTDGGETWAANQRVTDRSIDRRIGVWRDYGLRSNIGIASTRAAALVTWDDSRNGNTTDNTQDAYFTRLRFTEERADDDDPPDLLYLLAGVGAGMAVVGLVLLVGSRSRRS